MAKKDIAVKAAAKPKKKADKKQKNGVHSFAGVR